VSTTNTLSILLDFVVRGVEFAVAIMRLDLLCKNVDSNLVVSKATRSRNIMSVRA
jgi:hypothetical protein